MTLKVNKRFKILKKKKFKKNKIKSNCNVIRSYMYEDDLVKCLQDYGYEEVFCEKLTMNEKIQYFSNATHIVGAIGGGMCNCVFAYAGLTDCGSICIQGISFVRCKPIYRDSVICAASEIDQLKRSFSVT
jgi:hypothetical protein